MSYQASSSTTIHQVATSHAHLRYEEDFYQKEQVGLAQNEDLLVLESFMVFCIGDVLQATLVCLSCFLLSLATYMH